MLPKGELKYSRRFSCVTTFCTSHVDIVSGTRPWRCGVQSKKSCPALLSFEGLPDVVRRGILPSMTSTPRSWERDVTSGEDGTVLCGELSWVLFGSSTPGMSPLLRSILSDFPPRYQFGERYVVFIVELDIFVDAIIAQTIACFVLPAFFAALCAR